MSFDLWHSADPDAVGNDGNDLEPPADGTYTIALTGGAAFTSKKGDATIKLDLRAVGGPAHDYDWTVILQFKSQGQANMTKRQVRELGIDVDQITAMEALDTAIKQKVGGYFDVDVKTSGEFRNTYINGPAEPSDVAAPQSDVPADPDEFKPAAASPKAADDDDIPF